MVHWLLGFVIAMYVLLMGARLVERAWRPVIRPALPFALMLGGVGVAAWLLTS